MKHLLPRNTGYRWLKFLTVNYWGLAVGFFSYVDQNFCQGRVSGSMLKSVTKTRLGKGPVCLTIVCRLLWKLMQYRGRGFFSSIFFKELRPRISKEQGYEMWELLVKNTSNMHCVFVIVSDMLQSVSDWDLFFMCITIIVSLSRSTFYEVFCILIQKTFVFIMIISWNANCHSVVMQFLNALCFSV